MGKVLGAGIMLVMFIPGAAIRMSGAKVGCGEDYFAGPPETILCVNFLLKGAVQGLEFAPGLAISQRSICEAAPFAFIP